jgi:hypothetical protein
MATPYQYMLLTSTPEKEARFVQLKKKYQPTNQPKPLCSLPFLAW